MEYFTAIEISKIWNISSRMVAYYCETGRVEGAVKRGKTWLIPSHAEKPAHKRHARKKVTPAKDSIISPIITSPGNFKDVTKSSFEFENIRHFRMLISYSICVSFRGIYSAIKNPGDVAK